MLVVSLIIALSWHPTGRCDRLSFVRGVLLGGAVCAAPSTPAWASSEEQQDDEVPDVRLGSSGKKRSKPGSQKKRQLTESDVRAAVLNVMAMRRGLEGPVRKALKSDISSVAALLAEPPYSTFKEDSLVIVQGDSILGPDERKAIGTDRTFGVAADVQIMLGGLAEAARQADGPGAAEKAEKAAASLDEIITLCKPVLQ
mgnify:CR=1 FL=1